MPQPAEPAPTMTMRCSLSGTPVTCTAASSVAGRDRRGALDVVVEGAAAGRDSARAGGRRSPARSPPIAAARAASAHDRGDEGLDEVVVVLAADAVVPPADIERIGEALVVVGADVEQDRQAWSRGAMPAQAV